LDVAIIFHAFFFPTGRIIFILVTFPCKYGLFSTLSTVNDDVSHYEGY